MDKARSQQFMAKLVGDAGTVLAAGALYVGDRTGLFRAMAGAGALTPEALAQRSALQPRVVEEWLAVMAGAGYVIHDGDAGTFTLPDEHALFLTDASSEYYLGGLFAGVQGTMASLPRVAEAIRRGEGLRFTDYGSDMPLALEAMNRSVYEKRLVRDWLAAVPDAVQRLQQGGRALDLGCGTGIVPIALARAFERATVVGMDLDARSIELARQRAREAGIEQRVQWLQAGVESLPDEVPWDLITTFDVIHDLPDPLAALERIRGALAEGGTYLMVEPKVADELAENLGNPFARMLYGMSCLHCVPQSLAQGGPGLGACWGESRARRLAAQAGFGTFERLDVRSPVMAFYALRR
ncbi:MAG: methyltransferase domain-containing protein [Burkholderiaceae bacterium]